MDFEKDENNVAIRDESGLYISKDPITTIEKYFYYLPQLVQLGGATSSEEYTVLHSAGRRYTMLPIDEDTFDIDANARTITVPADFAKNGIGVQGDELSEVLYFKIDRFFDAMDLDTADIYVEWTRPDGESGVSKPWVIDIESQPNKIIFGWALSSAITKDVGTLRFAVRFFQWADDEHTKLGYSWATQVQTAQIKSTLDFTLGSDDYIAELGTDATIISRIQKSKTYVTDNEEAAIPEYVFNLADNIVDGSAVGKQEDGYVYIDLVDDGEGHETYTFKVQARSTDGGVISYTWSEKEHAYLLGTDADQGENGTKSVVGITFERTTDTEVKNKVYYEQKTESGVTVYKAVDANNLGINESTGEPYTPTDKGLYEKFATCTVKQIGTYHAVATNRKTGTNSTTGDSDLCIVPMPVDPTIGTELPSYNIIPEYINGEQVSDGSITLSVVATNQETNGSKNGTLSYTWWYKANESDTTYTQIKDQTSSSLVITNGQLFTGITEVENEDPVEAEIPSLEGFYMVRVNNHKNMEDTHVDSAICRVSYHAKAPVLSFPTNEAETHVTFGQEVHVTVDNTWKTTPGNSDGCTYLWYKSTDYDTNDPTNDSPVLGATGAIYRPEEQGNYYCVVTNHKNNTEASISSLVFSVA